MKDKHHILQMIKRTVLATEPSATLILFGSYARGEEREESDIDVLILVEREHAKMSWDEKMKIIASVSRIEWDAGVAISPIVYSKLGWAIHRVTPFYENVNREGVLL